MSSDFTQEQSDRERRRSQELSRRRMCPPTEVPGYEAQRFLGSGAYGEVWVALDRNTGRHVAIKFYAHRGGLDWSLLSREVEKLVFLSADRYVVQLLEVGWDADPPYYVMEYVENGSLEDCLEQRGALPVTEAVDLFREVAIGLTHAHGKGVLHCDLKPANVLLDQDNKPRLADFGQSRLSHEQTPALGTLFFMAPEQANLEAMPDARWDVYALGVLLYCMLTGDPPYRNASALAEIDKAAGLADRLARYRKVVRSQPAASAHRHVPGVDRALAEIIDRSLARKPKHRYANVQEVVAALRARDQARARRPLLVLGLLGPALLLLVMTLVGWWGYGEAMNTSDRGVTAKAMESNRFAAQYVAETAAHQLGRYFTAVEQVAGDEEFQDLLAETVEQEELAALLAKLDDPTVDGRALGGVRKSFQRHRAREAIQKRLQALLDDGRQPEAASWFVMNDRGIHVAAAFRSPPKQSPVGRYFGYRTYFHGGPADLPCIARPERAIRRTHLSAVFQSTATNTWKVAVSTPVVRRGQLLGILALTVEMGNFIKFEGSDRQFAVLVDGREGQNTGVILQHPLFDKILRRQEKLPERFGRDPEYRVKLDRQLDGDGRTEAKYRDPLGNDKQEGRAYRRDWIAAKAAVRLARGPADGGRAPTATDTGLIVLVQEDYNAATRPVHDLGKRLVRGGLIALGVVVGVVTLLWYFVIRTLSQPGSRVRRRRAGSESTRTDTARTLPAPHRERPVER